MNPQGYYYLHQNKDLIYKPWDEGRRLDLMDSDLVLAFWSVDLSRLNAWDILIEALSLGAKKDRVFELANKWGCTDLDADIYADKSGVKFNMDGDSWCATRADFQNITESPCGFGHTKLEAMADLCKHLEFRPTKIGWHKTFRDLVSK